MDDQTLAAQLRQPDGELGRMVAEKMSENNAFLYKQCYALMNIQEPDHVLEVGFGNGKFLRETLQQAIKGWVAGIDFSGEMVQVALAANQDLITAGKLEIRQGSVFSLSYKEETFDKVYTLNTLYFLDKPDLAFEEIHRVLKPGGMFCIGIRTASTMSKQNFTRHGFTLYELPQVTALFQKAGFAEIHSIHEHDTVSPQFDALSVTGVKR